MSRREARQARENAGKPVPPADSAAQTPDDDATVAIPKQQDDATVAIPKQQAGAPEPSLPLQPQVPEPKLSTQEQLRIAYDNMLQRDGKPLEPQDPPTVQLAALEDDVTTKQDKPKKKRRWMWWVFPPLTLLIVLGIIGYIFFTQAMSVKDDLTEMKAELSQVVKHVKAGDTDAVNASAEKIKTLSAKANEQVSNPLWDVAAHVPFVGANITAVAETTKATDIIVSEALPSVLQLLSTFDPKALKVDGGGVNLQPFRDVLPLLPALSDTFDKAQGHLDKIDRDAILPFVEDNIGQVIDMVGQATPLIEIGEKYLPTILPMLGDGGTRNYAVVFQNNAEIRATGGNPGNAAIMQVSDGKVDMREDWAVVAFGALGYSGYADLPAIEPETKRDLFESDTIQYVQNYTRFPDFRDTASYLYQLWNTATGENLDGVISLDPVILSYMLKVSGPVDVPGYDMQITGDNAVQILMSEAYEKFPDGRDSQAFFDAAAKAIFAKVMSGDWKPMDMIDAVNRGVAEQRVLASFVNQAEQAMVVEGKFDGEVPSDTSAEAQVGIYLNDASYSKLEYYLKTSMNVSCDASARTITTEITLQNNVPSGDLGNYTLGQRNSRFDLSRTTMMLDVLGLSLPGGTITAVSPGEGDVSGMDRSGNYNGADAKSLFMAVPMGESKTVSFTSSVPEGAKVPLTVRFSPTVTDTPVTIADSCVAMFPGTEVPSK